MTRPRAIRVAIAMLLQCSCAASYAEDRMSFTYKPFVVPGVMEFRFIYADGPFVSGTAKEFASFVEAKHIRSGAVVLLNSPGGLVSEALDLGRAIRAAGLDTEVGVQDGIASGRGGECYSACTLAFLGGVNRTIPKDAVFGVHRFSTDANLSSNEALDLGQIQMSQISEYIAYMGVAPKFANEMVRSPASSINMLSQDQLRDLKVITPKFHTDWEIKTSEGQFYVLGSTQTNGGLDKMMIVCDHQRMVAMMLFNTSGEYMDSALKYTSTYRWSFDGQEMEIPERDIVQRVRKTGPEYVGTMVRLTPEVLRRLMTTSELGFMMIPPSKAIFQGWTSDFQSGKQKFVGFAKTCH
jgi:hypothetical protein